MIKAVTANTILATWERAYLLGPVDRGLVLLNLARPNDSVESLITLTIGERDAALLELRARLFGADIQSLDSCPKCHEQIEVSFGVADIRVTPPTIPGTHSVVAAGGMVTLRAVTSADLIAVQHEASPESRRRALLSRCALSNSTHTNAEPTTSIAAIRGNDEPAIVAKLSEIDPQADVRMAVDCPRCSHAWSSRFDIASFLWAEIDNWAQRLLAEVHALAFAYGWSEADILSMSGWRRQIYLGMLRR